MIRGKGRLELMIRLEITRYLLKSVDRVIPRVTYCTSSRVLLIAGQRRCVARFDRLLGLAD